jgi:hypothetical protein
VAKKKEKQSSLSQQTQTSKQPEFDKFSFLVPYDKVEIDFFNPIFPKQHQQVRVKTWTNKQTHNTHNT